MFISKENAHQALAASPVLLNDLVQGLGYGWTAPTLRRIQDHQSGDLSLTKEQVSWIASLHEFGSLCAPLVSTPLMNLLGRKGVLALSSIGFVISYALIAFTKSEMLICWARVIFGLATGLHDITGAIYLGENMKPTLRGAFGSLTTAAFYGGLLVEFCLVNYLTYDTTAYINLTVGCVAIPAMFVSTETVEYLILKTRYEKALKNFLWLRGEAKPTVARIYEFERLKVHVNGELQQKGNLRNYLSLPVYRRTIGIVLAFCMLINATGFVPVSSYVSIAFAEGTFTPTEYTILFGTLQFLAALIGSTVMEKVNRRTILMFALLVSMLVHAATAALLYLQNRIYIPYFSWWIFITITVYSMMYSGGILPLFFTVRGELLPQNVKSFGNAVAIVGYSAVGFLTAKIFQMVSETLDVYWNFILYSVMSLVCTLYAYFILPETRGKSLMEIQNVLMEMQIKK